MRYFFYTYHGNKNFVTTKDFETFGAKRNNAGLPKKIFQLQRGDLIIYRDGSNRSCCTFLGASFVAGEVFDQGIKSPYKDYFWPDEEITEKILYPLRVHVDFESAPEIQCKVEWEIFLSLGFFNMRGYEMNDKRMWGAFFRGNYITGQDRINKISKLLGI